MFMQQLQIMISVVDPKPQKETPHRRKTQKENTKNTCQLQLCPLRTLHLISRKYILKQINNQQRETAQKMILNKNKMTTQLRLYCSQKEFMCRFYSNPSAILKLRSNNEQKNLNFISLHCYLQVNVDSRMFDLYRMYKKQKIIALKKIGRLHENQKSTFPLKGCFTPIPDDSDYHLKNLVNKIDNMIGLERRSQANLIQKTLKSGFQRSVRSSYKTVINNYGDFLTDQFTNTDEEVKNSLGGTFAIQDSVFGDSIKKISSINGDPEEYIAIDFTSLNHVKPIDQNQIQYQTQTPNDKKTLKDPKKVGTMEEKRLQEELYKLQTSEPISSRSNNIMDEYGILKKPPPDHLFKRKQKGPRSKKKNSLESSSSNSANKLSSKSRKKQESQNKKSGKGKRQCPYQQTNKKQQKNRKKESTKSTNKKGLSKGIK